MLIEITEKEKGKISKGGMGNALAPPTHPMHDFHVEGLSKDSFAICLSSALKYEWLDDRTKEKAGAILNKWEPLPLSNPDMQDWIHQVLGYFKHCYSKDGVGRNVNTDCVISEEPLDVNRHLGVMYIRSYYPHYCPTDKDFEGAYWGKKPESAA